MGPLCPKVSSTWRLHSVICSMPRDLSASFTFSCMLLCSSCRLRMPLRSGAPRMLLRRFAHVTPIALALTRVLPTLGGSHANVSVKLSVNYADLHYSGGRDSADLFMIHDFFTFIAGDVCHPCGEAPLMYLRCSARVVATFFMGWLVFDPTWGHSARIRCQARATEISLALMRVSAPARRQSRNILD